MRIGRERAKLLKDNDQFLEIISSITSSLVDPRKHLGSSILVTIDGPAGAGKTTLALQIEEHFASTTTSCIIIHLDDLYNGWDDALGESLTQIFSKALLPGVESGEPYFLPRFDWAANAYSQPRLQSPADLVIVEGVGAGQRVIRDKSALTIWIEVSAEVGLDRVLQRDGAGIREKMQNFQNAQRNHFLGEKSKESADFHFDGAP